MPQLDLDDLSPQERLLAEHAVLQYRALRAACSEAPNGKVLGVAERIAVDQGRELTRRTLETALQEEAAEAEKKGAPVEAARTVARRGRTAAAKSAR